MPLSSSSLWHKLYEWQWLENSLFVMCVNFACYGTHIVNWRQLWFFVSTMGYRESILPGESPSGPLFWEGSVVRVVSADTNTHRPGQTRPQLMSVILGAPRSSGGVNRGVFWDKENKSSIFSLWLISERMWSLKRRFGEKPNQIFNGC